VRDVLSVLPVVGCGGPTISHMIAAIACWIRRDQEGFDGVVGSYQEAVVLLPVVIGELISALERLVGPDEVARQVDEWLDIRRTRLAG
jgi:hypothetical protein